MKVSGDIQAVKDYLEGKEVCKWTYVEDMALSQPETAIEFKNLVSQKGREQIEKRRYFLLKVNTCNADKENGGDTLISKSAIKGSMACSQSQISAHKD